MTSLAYLWSGTEHDILFFNWNLGLTNGWILRIPSWNSQLTINMSMVSIEYLKTKCQWIRFTFLLASYQLASARTFLPVWWSVSVNYSEDNVKDSTYQITRVNKWYSKTLLEEAISIAEHTSCDICYWIWSMSKVIIVRPETSIYSWNSIIDYRHCLSWSSETFTSACHWLHQDTIFVSSENEPKVQNFHANELKRFKGFKPRVRRDNS